MTSLDVASSDAPPRSGRSASRRLTFAARGVFGMTSAATRDQHSSQEVTIDTDGSDLNLQIDLATFHHRDNGLKTSPVLGLSDAMSRWISLDWMQSFLLVTSLLLLA